MTKDSMRTGMAVLGLVIWSAASTQAWAKEAQARGAGEIVLNCMKLYSVYKQGNYRTMGTSKFLAYQRFKDNKYWLIQVSGKIISGTSTSGNFTCENCD